MTDQRNSEFPDIRLRNPALDDEAVHPIDRLTISVSRSGRILDRRCREQFPEKGKQTEQGRQQRETAVAI